MVRSYLPYRSLGTDITGEGLMNKLLFIATPHSGAVPAPYVNCLLHTWHDLFGKYSLGISTADSALVHRNRNHLFREAYNEKADNLLFIDTDIVWNPEDIEKLISLDKDIVSGVYKSRRPLQDIENAPVVFGKDDAGKLRVYEELPNIPFKTEAVGMGFCLIKRNVIETITDKIPELGLPFDFIHVDKMNQEHNPESNLAGEDISFCYRAKKAGFDIWVEPGVTVGHLTVSLIV